MPHPSILAIDPHTFDSSFLQYQIGSTPMFQVGLDTDGSYKISPGITTRTPDNSLFTMTPGGIRTIPKQPASFGRQTTDVLNATGDGTIYQIGSSASLTLDFNRNLLMSTGGVVTAPVTGIYLLLISVLIGNIANQHDVAQISFDVEGVNFNVANFNPFPSLSPGTDSVSLNGSLLTEMTAGDTAVGCVMVSGGTKTITVESDDIFTYVAGTLLF